VSGPPRRCTCAGERPLDIACHDRAWGVPQRDDVALCGLLTLEGAQARLNGSQALAGRDPGPERDLAAAESRTQARRLPLRRPDHLLRPDAGSRPGQRPPDRLLPPCRTRRLAPAGPASAPSAGLRLDPVYTGRAFAGLLDLVRRGRFAVGATVLFCYPGGAPALFSNAPDLTG
jgi:hypothetical protein